MKTYVCTECGKEIEKIEFDNGYLQPFDICNCAGHKISVPLDHYTSHLDMKCPYCGKYPFRNIPIKEAKQVVVVIDVDENIDDIL